MDYRAQAEQDSKGRRRRVCEDAGPFECAEEGCPAAVLSCDALASGEMCDLAFLSIWTKPPPGTERQSVHELCPKACSRCG